MSNVDGSASVAGDEVLYEVDAGVAVITINRPAARNALNRAAREALFAALRNAEADEDCRVVIITGTGDKSFCSGADLKELAADGTKVPGKDFTPRLRKNVDISKPVIAAVNGPAYAGGFLLAQMCDLCVASDSATFAISEAKWGRGAPWAAPLSAMLPQRVMMELLLTAQPLSAQRMYDLGMVNRVVPGEDLLATAREMADTIARNAPLTVAGHLRMTYLCADMGVTAAEEAADEFFSWIYRSEDAQEGPRAFREKRSPAWQGR